MDTLADVLLGPVGLSGRTGIQSGESGKEELQRISHGSWPCSLRDVFHSGSLFALFFGSAVGRRYVSRMAFVHFWRIGAVDRCCTATKAIACR